MAERFIRASHLRSLVAGWCSCSPLTLAVATILAGAFTGAERPTGADGGGACRGGRDALGTAPAA